LRVGSSNVEDEGGDWLGLAGLGVDYITRRDLGIEMEEFNVGNHRADQTNPGETKNTS